MFVAPSPSLRGFGILFDGAGGLGSPPQLIPEHFAGDDTIPARNSRDRFAGAPSLGL